MASDLRCSTWTREEGVDPVGSAGSYAGFLLVEWPLPWPRDVSEIPELEPVAAAARKAGHRLQALVPVPGRGPARVVHYRWDADRGRFEGREAPAGGDAAGVALALLAGREPPGTGPVAGPDVLICGHGRRDRCCGSLGTSLQEDVARAGRLPADVRLWRTSHTGGHRFAPTAIVLPEGTCWGYLDAGAVAGIVTREGPAIEQTPRYRGCAGLASGAVQALERDVLAEVGWDLLDRPRRGEEDGDGTVRLSVDEPGGRTRTWQARVRVSRVLPVPQCGQPVTGAEKTEEELAVEERRELSVTAGS
jgi:hypothetical protein